jgi:thiamine monophosphate kinase
MKNISTFRDVAITQLENFDFLVTAVDSCGSIGQKPADELNVDLKTVGLFTTRVALLEVLSVGAMPVCVSVAICNEPETAQDILSGVEQSLCEYINIPKVISTEKNMATCMTALGITITGVCKQENLRLGTAKSGDYLYCAGMPLVGQETLAKNTTLFEPRHLKTLFSNKQVHSIIPVGSRGIAIEAQTLAKESKIRLLLFEKTGLNLNKSAGPASCAVFSAEGCCEDYGLDIPVTMIGKLE